MAEGGTSKTPMVIEGYQVFAEGQSGSMVVKQEPVDPDFHDAAKSSQMNGSASTSSGMDQGGVRELLKQIVENHGKELTVSSVVERLLQKNELILAQSDAQLFKPHPRTVKQKPAGRPEENHGSVLQPKDPTSHCTKEDITTKDINEALVEVAVNSVDSNCDTDLVCAVGSKIILMTSQGQPLQMDLMCYWCNFCNFRSDKKDALLTHVMEHRFHCKYCKFQSFSRATVIHHCMDEHESFGETAKTLRYCTYLPDFLLSNEQKTKRKHVGACGDSPNAKKAKTRNEPEEELNMEVEEVDDAPVVDTSGERILTPRKQAAKKSVKAPVQTSVAIPVRQIPSTAVTIISSGSNLLHTARVISAPEMPKLQPQMIIQSTAPMPSLVEQPGPSGNSGLPVIANVMSGQMAISAATNSELMPSSVLPQQPALVDSNGVSVSSGLCWQCGYCGFVTLGQAFLKIHLNAQHAGKAHKYVAMLVSNAEEIKKIKASDAQLVASQAPGTFDSAGNPTSTEVVVVAPPPVVVVQSPPGVVAPPAPVATPMIPVTVRTPTPPPTRSTLPAPTPKSTVVPKPVITPTNTTSKPTTRDSPKTEVVIDTITEVVIDNAEEPEPVAAKENDSDKTSDTKKVPVSYKCAHCNFSAPQADKIKAHLFQRHGGSVMYALDMKAVKLRQQRYVFFCMKPKCTFHTKDADDYIEHSDHCTPWLDGKERKDVDSSMIKSLDLTKQFIIKTNASQGQSGDMRPDKSAEYGCIYCSYISNNNTRLKKHVLSNHQEKSCMIKDQAAKDDRNPAVYFCQYCLWETRSGSELELHLTEKHQDESKEKKLDGTDKRLSPVPSTSKVAMPSTSKVATPSTSKVAMPSTSKAADEKTHKTPDNKPKSGGVTHSRASKVGQSTKGQNDDSSRESSPTLSEGGDTDNDEEDRDYLGIISNEEYEKAMKLYIASEDTGEKKRGRPSRDAALKAQLKVKSFKPPQLFKCMHCTDIYFGVKLMRRHIRAKHNNQPLRAIDMLRLDKKHPNPHYCFCTQDKCVFCAVHATDVVNHAKNSHGIQATNPDLVRISTVLNVTPVASPHCRPATASTGESYECLYCTTSKMYHSRRDMKKHLLDRHNDEEFIYRDCIARKLRQPSRFYMCQHITCDYTTEKQKDYSLHLLGHQEAKIYECSKCGWFTANPDQVAQHALNVHKAEKVTSLEIDLKLDSQGNIVKLVGGTVIKREKI